MPFRRIIETKEDLTPEEVVEGEKLFKSEWGNADNKDVFGAIHLSLLAIKFSRAISKLLGPEVKIIHDVDFLISFFGEERL